jgi:hypothetical protein
MPNTPQLVPA